jgi:tripartite-type tricarboxylate transporter receptor subunit TctC
MKRARAFKSCPIDLVASQIDMAIVDPVVSMPQVRAGAIKAYGVTAKTRLLSAPDIPTLDEAGLPGFDISFLAWALATKGCTEDIAILNAAIIDALADPKVRARLADLSQATFPRAQQTPEALGALQKAEIDKWWAIIKAAGINWGGEPGPDATEARPCNFAVGAPKPAGRPLNRTSSAVLVQEHRRPVGFF